MSSAEQLQAETSGPQMTGPKRPAPRGTAFYPRKRAVTACQVCRARRTKCDNLKPTCSFCLKTGAVCIQSSVDLSSFDPASLKILERLDDVEGLLKSLASHSGIHSFSTAASGCPSSGQHARKDIQPDLGQTRPVLSSILPERLEDILAWPIFAGDSNSNDALWGVTTDSNTHVIDLQFSTPGTSVADAASVNTPSPTALATLLEDMPQLVSSLVENFFNYVHVKNPILDEAATGRLVSVTTIEGIDWSLKSCLTLLVCALGSIAGPFVPGGGMTSGSRAYANAQALFQAAERRLGACVGSGELMAIQCLFLAGVYMMCVLQPQKAWRFFNTALAACQEFPFLRQPPPDDFSSIQDDDENAALGGCQESVARDKESVLRQALYWSAWKSERELRSELRLPDFNLADRDRGLYPAFFPTPPPPPPQKVTEAPVAWSDLHKKPESPAWYFYLAEISLRRLFSNICAEMLSLRCEQGDDTAFLAAAALAVPTWEMQAQRWIDSLPPMLSLDALFDLENDICRFVLRGHLINLFELIYWPFVVAAITGFDMSLGNSDTQPQRAGAAKPATEKEAADSPFILQLARKGLEAHTRRIIVNEPGFRHRHHGTWYMIRNCERSALILVASAICIARRGCLVEGGPNNEFLAMPDGWRDSVASTVRLLAYWEPEAPDLRKGRRILEVGLRRAVN
ncbi:Zcf27p [Sporothrix bragantina]|uniref:Zcf27p n=1 Tax=Sporothrix bragantina TaxID=671064 RepID=A0ABP0ASL2_9PEZI